MPLDFNSQKNILIIGLGSMGKRRARLIKNLFENAIICGVDKTSERREEAQKLGIKAFDSIENAVKDNNFDAAFVCTAPITHAKIIDELLENNLNVFTELNLIADDYDKLINKANDKNLQLFLSSTMLYRKETQYIKQQIQKFNKPVNYIYHIGQYLPDWHPWENYKNFFVGDARTSGIREIFGIELPWLLDAFGEVSSVFATSDKLTQLDLPYDDSFYVVLRHKNGTKGILAADVVCAKPVRNLEVFGEDLHLFWEGSPTSLYEFNTQTKQKCAVDTYVELEQDSRYSDNIVENAYVDEIMNFFKVLNNEQQALWSFKQDKIALELIDNIEAKAKEAKF